MDEGKKIETEEEFREASREFQSWAEAMEKPRGEVPIYDARELASRLSPVTTDLLLRWQFVKLRHDKMTLLGASNLDHFKEYSKVKEDLLRVEEPEIVTLARFANAGLEGLEMTVRDTLRCQIREKKRSQAEKELLKISCEIQDLYPHLHDKVN